VTTQEFSQNRCQQLDIETAFDAKLTLDSIGVANRTAMQEPEPILLRRKPITLRHYHFIPSSLIDQVKKRIPANILNGLSGG
jgi:hypothetical protein